jgi:sporulation protein YlmC with PRC-barrel domain
MRDADNIKDVTIEVDGKRGKIESFWILPETNEVYVKLKHGTVTCNYRLTQLDEKMIIVKKRSRFDE